MDSSKAPLAESQIFFDMAPLQRAQNKSHTSDQLLNELFTGAATCTSEELVMTSLVELWNQSQWDLRLKEMRELDEDLKRMHRKIELAVEAITQAIAEIDIFLM